MADSSPYRGSGAKAPGKPQYLTLVPVFEQLTDGLVTIRPYREEDAQELYESIAESREHLRPWLPFADEHQSVEESREWINGSRSRWILREAFNCNILDAKTGRSVGGVGLHPHDWAVRYFEIGYWLRASAEGHGYTTAAARLLADFAMNELQAQRLVIRCDEENVRSAAVARRLGFVFEGVLRNELQESDGRLANMMYFSRVPGDEAKT